MLFVELVNKMRILADATGATRPYPMEILFRFSLGSP